MKTSKTSSKAGERLEVLDGFRCIAILAVAVFHYTVRWSAPLDPMNHLPQAEVFSGIIALQYGWIGVDLFFLISGFVIFMTLERCKSLVDFATRRVARLWPPVLVCGTLTVVVLYFGGPSEWRPHPIAWLSSLLLFPPDLLGKVLHRSDLAWPDGAYWTLWIEVRFYAILSLMYLVLKRHTFIGLVFVTIAAAILARVTNGAFRSLLELAFFPVNLPFFTLGICGYLVYSGRNSNIVSLSMVAVTVLILFQAGFDYLPNNAQPLYCVVAHLIILTLFFLFVAKRAPKWLAAPPLQAIGRASYSFYLMHQIVGVVIIMTLVRWGASIFVAIPIAFLTVLSLAFALVKWVEEPAKEWIHRHTRPNVEWAERRIPWLNFG